MSARTLGIVVSRPDDLAAALAVAAAARAQSIEVGMFFMSDAVAALPDRLADLADLAEADCELVCCAGSAHERGLAELHVGMLLGSQDDHAALVHRADRVVAFT